jgi:hypothetical protein
MSLSLPAYAPEPQFPATPWAPLSLDGRGVGGEGVRRRHARPPAPSPLIPLPQGERETRDSRFLGRGNGRHVAVSCAASL